MDTSFTLLGNRSDTELTNEVQAVSIHPLLTYPLPKHDTDAWPFDNLTLLKHLPINPDLKQKKLLADQPVHNSAQYCPISRVTIATSIINKF